MKNKRGIGFEQIALILVIVAGLILVLLSLWGPFMKLIGFSDKIDIDQAALSQQCSNSFSVDETGTTYCTSRYLVADDTYINCPYAKEKYGVNIPEDSFPSDESLLICQNAEVSICNRLKLEESGFDASKYSVNGAVCAYWMGCVDAAGNTGVWVKGEGCSTGNSTGKTEKINIEGKHDAVLSGYKCCV